MGHSRTSRAAPPPIFSLHVDTPSITHRARDPGANKAPAILSPMHQETARCDSTHHPANRCESTKRQTVYGRESVCDGRFAGGWNEHTTYPAISPAITPSRLARTISTATVPSWASVSRRLRSKPVSRRGGGGLDIVRYATQSLKGGSVRADACQRVYQLSPLIKWYEEVCYHLLNATDISIERSTVLHL
jgi:hypothetical protein